MIDLDKHSELGPSDITRVLELCGEPEPTEAEVLEMIRLFDPDGSGSVEFKEFRQNFMRPPAVFRNFDLHKRDGAQSLGASENRTPMAESEEAISRQGEARSDSDEDLDPRKE